MHACFDVFCNARSAETCPAPALPTISFHEPVDKSVLVHGWTAVGRGVGDEAVGASFVGADDAEAEDVVVEGEGEVDVGVGVGDPDRLPEP